MFLHLIWGFFIFCCATSLFGVTATWNLNANGSWNVNGNWTPTTFPNAMGFEEEQIKAYIRQQEQLDGIEGCEEEGVF